jgi:FlaA1/EpsC-like NDP-sugar epimerase
MVEWYEPWAQRYGADREIRWKVFFADLGYRTNIAPTITIQVYKRYKMKTVLITGANGFIGHYSSRRIC